MQRATGKSCSICQGMHPAGEACPTLPSEEAFDAYGDTPPPRDPLIGARIGEYEILERVGAGGMGFVYKGRQTEIGRGVAIKVLKAELVGGSVSGSHGLLKEARAISTIRHRGIVDIFGFGTLPTGQQYMVMELLEGEPLEKHLKRRGRLAPMQTAQYLEEILSALDAAHSAGVIHRDLKPSNIFIVEQGGTRFLKLLDFGLAKKDVGVRGESPQTNMNQLAGTPEYMSPEQTKGQSVGPYSDLYSVGVIAYELLTGELPYKGASPIEILIGHMQKPVPSVATLVPDVPAVLDAYVARLMAKLPGERPANADVALSELRSVIEALKDPTKAAARTPKKTARTKLLAATIGTAVLGAVAFVALSKPTPQPQVVVVEVEKPIAAPPPVVKTEEVKSPPPVVVVESPQPVVEEKKKPVTKKTATKLVEPAKQQPEKPLVVVLANAPEPQKVEAPTAASERTRLLGRIAQLEQRFSQREEPDKLAQTMLSTYRERAIKAQTIDDIAAVSRMVDQVEKRFNP